MNFRVDPAHMADARISADIPADFNIRRIDPASVRYVEGRFGRFASQVELASCGTIAFLKFQFKQSTIVHPEVWDPMVAFYGMLKGNVLCKLDGHGNVLLEQKEFGPYYIPPDGKNDAFFKAGDFEGFYIAPTGEFLSNFINQHPHFEHLNQLRAERAMDGLVFPRFKLKKQDLHDIERLRCCKLTGAARDVFQEAIFTKLMGRYLQYLERAMLQLLHREEQERKVQLVARHIRKFYYQHTEGMDTWVAVANMTAGTLVTIFKDLYDGITPSQFLEEIRMKDATRLLIETNKKVHVVANEIGYNSARYFSEVFCKKFGASPKDFRKKNN
jgi:AraC-like DNA-binding protein